MKPVVPPRTPTCPPARIEVPLPSLHRLMFPLVCFGEGTGEETVLILFCLKPEGLHLRCCSGSSPPPKALMGSLLPTHISLNLSTWLTWTPRPTPFSPGMGRAGQGRAVIH